MQELSTEQMQGYVDTVIEMALTFGPKLVLAVIVLLAGLWVIKRLVKLTGIAMQKGAAEPTLARFLGSLVSIGLKALLLISVASMIGIETTSFIAIIGAAGLAIGLALQGSLANFAGGVLILMFRPFKVGDFIDAQGITGTVKEIQIFSTIISTGDNKTIIVPNGALSNGIITNFSKAATRRVDFVFGIGYDDDIAKAKAVLERLVAEDTRIHADPAHLIVVSELADSSVNFTVRVWVNSADYSGVFFDMTENVKLAFDAENISIPFPQTDVHLQNQSV